MSRTKHLENHVLKKSVGVKSAVRSLYWKAMNASELSICKNHNLSEPAHSPLTTALNLQDWLPTALDASCWGKLTSRTSESINSVLLKYRNFPAPWLRKSTVMWVREKMKMSQKEIEQQEDRFLASRIRTKFDENMVVGRKRKVRSVIKVDNQVRCESIWRENWP